VVGVESEVVFCLVRVRFFLAGSRTESYSRTRKTLDVRRERYNTKSLVMVEKEEEEEGVGSKLAERI
jgi:hypothetical protein